ncbi:hypothetical protein [Kitasatospora sp. MBT63]|uniref:hypothetical protein n=1 Tax=Kitasatospora sp. MBT63 TaxID=1444768 RepID=UPI00068DE425|nr:hypothetical protein [Kitasatospora sp. MBT63]
MTAVKAIRALEDRANATASRLNSSEYRFPCLLLTWLPGAEHEELRRLRRQNLEQQKTIEVLKKAGLLRAGERPVSEVHRFIAAEKATHSVTLLCRIFGVLRSRIQLPRTVRIGASEWA